MVWAAERWGRYSIMFFIHPTSLRHLHIMYMRSLPRNQNFQKCWKYNFVLFIVFTLKIFITFAPPSPSGEVQMGNLSEMYEGEAVAAVVEVSSTFKVNQSLG